MQYEKYFFPLLHKHQRVFVVPGIYGRGTKGSNSTAAAAEDMGLVRKLQGYIKWANDDHRLAGLIPWHWPRLRNIRPAFMELGAAEFPRLLEEVAKVVRSLPPITQAE